MAKPSPVLETAAFANAERAFGVRYRRPGMTTSPARDLELALGWPHVRYLSSAEPPPPKDPAEGWRTPLADHGRAIPRSIAVRRVRGNAAFACDPWGKPSEAALEALADDRPFDASTATDFIREHLAKPFLSNGYQPEIPLVLEALVGPDAVLSAIVDAFEAASDERLRAHLPGLGAWAAVAGALLLRVEKSAGDTLLERMRAIVERGFATEPEQSSAVVHLDRAISGHLARRPDKHLVLRTLASWSDAPLAVVLDALSRATVDSWSFSVEPRLFMLAGEPAVDLYRAKWSFAKDAALQRDLVELLGVLQSPGIPALMKDLAEKSKAKKQAQAWLDTHASSPSSSSSPSSPSSPSSSSSSSSPSSSSSSSSKLLLPSLSPTPILTALDAAVLGNDWPDFFELDPEDLFHALRVLAVRTETEWGLLFERLEGCDPESLQVRHWTFGPRVDPNRMSEVIPVSFSLDDEAAAALLESEPRSSKNLVGTVITGPRGVFRFEKDMTARYALALPKRHPQARFTTLARAYHAHFGGGLWQPLDVSAALLGLGNEAQIVVASDAYEHAALPLGNAPLVLPSTLRSFQTLARAVAEGDGSLFDPGVPNTHWRRAR